MTVTGRAALPTDICPHGVQLGDCAEAWCRNRVEDLANGEYEAKPLEAPETTTEARTPDALGKREQRASWQQHLTEAASVAISIPELIRHARSGDAVCFTCGGHWSGEKICHCSLCHLTFTHINGFDAHRPGTGERGCMDEAALRERGYAPNSHGHWRKPRPPESLPQKENDAPQPR